MNQIRIAYLPVLIALLTYCFALQDSSRDVAKPGFQPWVKKGIILKPGFAGTRSGDGLSAPAVVHLTNGRLRLYFWAREQDSGYYIYAAEASPDDPYKWSLVSEQPMLGPVPNDKLDDQGPA